MPDFLRKRPDEVPTLRESTLSGKARQIVVEFAQEKFLGPVDPEPGEILVHGRSDHLAETALQRDPCNLNRIADIGDVDRFETMAADKFEGVGQVAVFNRHGGGGCALDDPHRRDVDESVVQGPARHEFSQASDSDRAYKIMVLLNNTERVDLVGNAPPVGLMNFLGQHLYDTPSLYAKLSGAGLYKKIKTLSMVDGI